MKKKRLIPILLLRNGWLVQSKYFSEYKNLGNPITAVKRLSKWASDELIYLDISADETYDLRRDDLNTPNRHTIFEILDDISESTFMPITVGGKIRTIADIKARLLKGADKISINTQALDDLNFVTKAAQTFGSQCIVVSIDAKLVGDTHMVFKKSGSIATDLTAVEWALQVEAAGAGEILLNSIDRDGSKLGFDIPLIKQVAAAVKIPVIAAGGAGSWADFGEVFTQTNADAVAAANLFQHVDQSVYLAKKYLYESKYMVRPPSLLGIEERL